MVALLPGTLVTIPQARQLQAYIHFNSVNLIVTNSLYYYIIIITTPAVISTMMFQDEKYFGFEVI